MILRPWSPDVCLERVDLCSVPVWVSLPNLTFHFWSSEALSSIGSVIGKPIITDKMTRSMERLSYARLCVEVSANEELPLSVPVYGDGGFVFNQRVVYDWKPPLCVHCKVFGHMIDACKSGSRKPDKKYSRTKQEWRVKGAAGKEAATVAGNEADLPAEQTGIGNSNSNLDSHSSRKNKGGDLNSLGQGANFGKKVLKKSS
ncbi:uncharacterized protein LOC122665474 [Telopea speciosissima]|uniref:uncharacterized protein LOC122665474 n=1 Tax=Telopea speciosissima TaxID=54955 RepID=UPI001CC6D833|nr:uncharacterized protein LOC122665474 [Telopea speciosissima]